MYKIVKQDANELHLSDGIKTLNIIFNVFFFIIGLCYGGIYFYHNTGSTTISCKRIEPTQVNCKITESFAFGLVRKSQSVLDVTRSEFIQTKSEGDDDCSELIQNTVAVVLRNGTVQTVVKGRHYVNCVSGDEDRMRQIVDRFNQFLDSERQAGEFEYETQLDIMNNIFPLVIVLLLLICGLPGLFNASKIRTLALIKQKDSVWKEAAVFGLIKTEEITYPIGDIQRVAIETSKDSDDDTWYELKLKVKSGKDLVLGRTMREENVRGIARQIREFLDLPEEVTD